MANLELNTLIGEVNKTYGNWVVTFGTAEKPRTCEFFHLVRAPKDARKKFWETALLVQRILSGNLTDEESDSLNTEYGEAYAAIASKNSEVLESVAVNKADFKAMAKELGNDPLLWDKVLGSYFEHFDLVPGEQKPSQNS